MGRNVASYELKRAADRWMERHRRELYGLTRDELVRRVNEATGADFRWPAIRNLLSAANLDLQLKSNHPGITSAKARKRQLNEALILAVERLYLEVGIAGIPAEVATAAAEIRAKRNGSAG